MSSFPVMTNIFSVNSANSLKHLGKSPLTETETDKSVLYRIVWSCSYCIDTLTPLGTVVILSVSFSVSGNEPLDNRQRMDLQYDDENTTV